MDRHKKTRLVRKSEKALFFVAHVPKNPDHEQILRQGTKITPLRWGCQLGIHIGFCLCDIVDDPHYLMQIPQNRGHQWGLDPRFFTQFPPWRLAGCVDRGSRSERAVPKRSSSRRWPAAAPARGRVNGRVRPSLRA